MEDNENEPEIFIQYDDEYSAFTDEITEFMCQLKMDSRVPEEHRSMATVFYKRIRAV